MPDVDTGLEVTSLVRARFLESPDWPLTVGGMANHLDWLKTLVAIHHVTGLRTPPGPHVAAAIDEMRGEVNRLPIERTNKSSPWEVVLYVGAASSALTTAVRAAILTFHQVQAARRDLASTNSVTAQASAEVEYWNLQRERFKALNQPYTSKADTPRRWPWRARRQGRHAADWERSVRRQVTHASNSLDGLDEFGFVPDDH